jgi:hypothetical protein
MTQSRLIGWSLGSLALCIGALLWLARGPDFELHFERVSPSEAPESLILYAMNHLEKWPDWHFDLRAVQVLPPTAPASGTESVLLQFEPKTKQWKRFELQARVRPVSRTRTEVELTEDRQGKLSRLFQDVRWSVELQGPVRWAEHTYPRSLKGELTARTHHWRARLFGRLTPRILLNQVFYPDLQGLSRVDQPKAMESAPSYTN